MFSLTDKMNTIDKYGVNARVRDFDQRNGGNPVSFKERLYYANGAQRDSDPLGALIDPPADEYARLSNILRYHQGRCAAAVREFDHLKEELEASGCPQPEGLDQLRRLQAIVSERNQAVNAAKARLEETGTGQRLQASRRIDAEIKQEMDDYREALRQIRI